MSELISNSYTSNEVRRAINNAFSGTATFNSFSVSKFSSSAVTLVDDAVITWDCSLGQNAIVTLTDNRVLKIINAYEGGGNLIVKQDGVGGRTLSFYPGTSINYVVSGGTGAITLSSAANAVDIISFFCPSPAGADTFVYYWNIENNYS